jgi:DNA-binding NarL/FixJ family response regulator
MTDPRTGTSPKHREAPVIRLMVVDDHGIVCEGLTALLEREESMTVVGSAATGREAVLAARRLKPDVIIMDLVLPDLNGIDATQLILAENPSTRVIALSACHSAEHVHRALRAGAHGYALKDAAARELVLAVKTVVAGRQYLSPAIAAAMAPGLSTESLRKSPIERLSLRERQVLRRIVDGATSAAIAEHLSLSRKTVDTYRGRLMVKLGVDNRSALIRCAIEHELIPL